MKHVVFGNICATVMVAAVHHNHNPFKIIPSGASVVITYVGNKEKAEEVVSQMQASSDAIALPSNDAHWVTGQNLRATGGIV